MKLLTIVQYLVSNWSRINPLFARAVELVKAHNSLPASGQAKRYAVFNALADEFLTEDTAKHIINLVIEIVVGILKWRGVIK